MSEQDKREPSPQAGGNGWVSCGIPTNRQEYGAFWTLWAASKESRRCPCGCMVISGPCPDCGREYVPYGSSN